MKEERIEREEMESKEERKKETEIWTSDIFALQPMIPAFTL